MFEKASPRVGVLTLWLRLPGCGSLKEKRRRLRPLLSRLQREFNASVAEVAAQDAWQDAVIACAWVGTDAAYVQRALQGLRGWLETHWPEGWVVEERFEVY